MSGDDVASTLEGYREEVRERFGVRTLRLFGSAARGELSPGSDVDLFVEFDGMATFDRFMGLKLFLAEILDRPVDRVTAKALPATLRSTVEREGQRVA